MRWRQEVAEEKGEGGEAGLGSINLDEDKNHLRLLLSEK
jgi:hypothetical protein